MKMQTKIDLLEAKIKSSEYKIIIMEKQIASLTLNTALFKKLFEFYADLISPDTVKRSGSDISAWDNLNVATSTGSPSNKNFSDLSLDYGFKNFYGEMDVNLDVRNDFTMFFIIKHDTSLPFVFGTNFRHTDPTDNYSIDVRNSGNFSNLRLRPSNFVSPKFINLADNFKNKQIMIWAVKNGSTYTITIAGTSNTITETHSYSEHTSSKIPLHTMGYLLRMGFTTNSYAIGGDAYKATALAEQKLGTYFGLD